MIIQKNILSTAIITCGLSFETKKSYFYNIEVIFFLFD